MPHSYPIGWILRIVGLIGKAWDAVRLEGGIVQQAQVRDSKGSWESFQLKDVRLLSKDLFPHMQGHIVRKQGTEQQSAGH